jgi:hypothetical protein
VTRRARRRLTLGLLLFFAWLVARPGVPAAALGPVGARPGGLVVARPVTSDATAENSQRKLGLGGGRLYLAYVRPVNGVPQVFVAISRDRGISWQHTQVSALPAPARLPSLAVFPDGSLHVVWTQYAPVGGVRHRVLRAGRWTNETLLSSPGVYAGVPVVAAAQGNPHVLWYGIRPERPNVPTRHSSIYEILATQRRAAGWTSPQLISPGVPDSINPSLDALPGGRLYTAWMQFDGRAYQVRGASFQDGWSGPEWLTTGSMERTRVALAAEGRVVHLVWEEHAPVARVVYRRLGATAASQISERGPAQEPNIAAAGGAVAAVWNEGQEIRVRSLRPTGPIRTVGRGRSPVVATDGTTAYVAWTWTADGAPELRFAAVRLR